MDLGLQGKVAFVTGSSRGIGLAIARAFLREGAKVIITGRNADTLQHANAVLVEEANAARVLSVRGDMTDAADIRRALGEGIAVFGGLDVAVANVGSGAGRGGWEVSSEEWQSALHINLVGGMTLAHAALPHLLSRSGSSLIFVSSIAGHEAINAPVPYSAAKAAVQSAAKSLARLVGSHGVRVNAVAPGNVLFPGGEWDRKLGERRGSVEQYIRSEVPLQRFGTLEEIADTVIFLASARASFITGACVVVDGGQTRSFP